MRAVLVLAFLAFAVPARAEPCAPRTFEGARYTVCTLDLRQYGLRLFWRDAQGEPYGSFGRLPKTVNGAPLVFAMNAGMYEIDLSPVGLYVEDGRQHKAANTRPGPGNFHLKPNGVFFVEGRTAGVLETGAYLKRKPKADFATQSGPMLVIGGRLHPRFIADSPSEKRRNGVGVRDRHTVVFAISEGVVNFHAFARLFRDGLGVRDALFLDGSMSSLYAPALGRADAIRLMGPIVAAFPRK
ncbi:MAG TPA: phosphodiester glycosidase family protein [Beijerinckiaceae bacterium]|nr:phosphodiester glycosidase family protein [Beijerinckiaceae bacterium]